MNTLVTTSNLLFECPSGIKPWSWAGIAGGSVNNHYLGSYQQALLAVALSQFSSKRYRSGMLGVLSLAESSPPFAYLFEKELGLSVDEMRCLSR